MYSHFSWAAANCQTLHPQNIGIKHRKLTWTQMFSLFNMFGCGFSTRKLDGLQIYTLPFLGGFGWDEMRFLYIISPRQSKRGSINYQQTTNKAPSTMLSELAILVQLHAIAMVDCDGLWIQMHFVHRTLFASICTFWLHRVRHLHAIKVKTWDILR